MNRLRFLLIPLGILLALLLLEGFLRLYSIAAEKAPEPTVPDSGLEWRPKPGYQGNDSRGWRNTSALERADIVVLGDSQTYGVNAHVEGAWPQQLSPLLHRSVYQMAYGGYGPVHYLLLIDEALQLKPKVLIATYYFGNDNFDSYRIVYLRHGPDLRLDLLTSADPQTLKAISRAEEIDPEFLRIDYLDCSNPRSVPDPRLQIVHDILKAPPLAPLENASLQKPSVWTDLDLLLKRWSKLYRTLGNRLELLKTRGKPAPDYGPPLCIHYRDRPLATVFTVGYRLIALDETDPRIIEGERVSLLAFKYLAERCRLAGIQFFVTLIPTKETAFRIRIERALQNQPYLVHLWNAEAHARTRALAFFNRERIPAIDTLPALEAVIASDVNPYRENTDGHPVAVGYGAIARAVGERLQRVDLPSRP